MNNDLIGLVLLIYVLLFAFILPSFGIYFEHRAYKKELRGLKIGDKYKKEIISQNPFEETEKYIIRIEDIKLNNQGETWLRVKFSDGSEDHMTYDNMIHQGFEKIKL
jgi:hypothetical protein